MKVLLVGPYPPPHGGISVHVAQARRLLNSCGAECRVLNIDRTAGPSPEYERVRHGFDLARIVLAHAAQRQIIHVHINGHNRKAWLLAAACAVAAFPAPARLLTLHSGMAPAYVDSAHGIRRRLLRRICLLYSRIVCVNSLIRRSILSLGIPSSRACILPAFLPLSVVRQIVPRELWEWMESHRPLLSTALFFRPEYGFDLLVEAMSYLLSRYPSAGCVVMGSREGMDSERAGVERKGLASHFRFLGDINHDLCLGLMSRSDVYVRPTREDGDSISVREALHLGVPVVASDVGVRPSAALTFRAGNVPEMVARIEQALSKDHCPPQGLQSGRSESGPRTLLDIYQGLAGCDVPAGLPQAFPRASGD